jgi:hypothetical protein
MFSGVGNMQPWLITFGVQGSAVAQKTPVTTTTTPFNLSFKSSSTQRDATLF